MTLMSDSLCSAHHLDSAIRSLLLWWPRYRRSYCNRLAGFMIILGLSVTSGAVADIMIYFIKSSLGGADVWLTCTVYHNPLCELNSPCSVIAIRKFLQCRSRPGHRNHYFYTHKENTFGIVRFGARFRSTSQADRQLEDTV